MVIGAVELEHTENNASPVVKVARRRAQAGNDAEQLLSTGIRARLVPVAAALVEEAMAEVKDPPIPKWHNPDKDREEDNPSDPGYLDALAEARRQRGLAAIDTAIMFGVELLDGLPEDDSWIKKLKFLEKRGRISLAGYDLEDQIDLEFVYKKFIAVGGADYGLLGGISGISAAEVAQASKNSE